MQDFMKVIQHCLIKHPKEVKVLALQYSNFSAEFAHGKWALPGGHLKIGEEPSCGLIREVREETGIEIMQITPYRVHTMLFPDGVYRYGMIFTAVCETSVVKLSKEHLDYKWLNHEELNSLEFVNLTFQNTVKDFLTELRAK